MKGFAVVFSLGVAQANGQLDPTDIASDADFPKFSDFLSTNRGGVGLLGVH